MEGTYAQALYSLSQQPGADAGKLVETLVTHLKAEGRMKLLPRILRELKRIEQRSASLGESLEVASENEIPTAISEAAELGVTAPPIVNETLVTGWRARIGSRIIDRSGKRSLIDLYRRITAYA